MDNFEEMLAELEDDVLLEKEDFEVANLHHEESLENSTEIEESLIDLVSSDSYPMDFPRARELQNLKNNHGEIYFVAVGSLAELYLGSSFRNFIIRPIQKDDVVEYLSNGLELRDLSSFDAFMVKKCSLFPVLDDSIVSKLPFGVFEALINQIKLHSKLETTVNVSKI